jgi:hypothetical protein
MSAEEPCLRFLHSECVQPPCLQSGGWGGDHVEDLVDVPPLKNRTYAFFVKTDAGIIDGEIRQSC